MQKRRTTNELPVRPSLLIEPRRRELAEFCQLTIGGAPEDIAAKWAEVRCGRFWSRSKVQADVIYYLNDIIPHNYAGDKLLDFIVARRKKLRMAIIARLRLPDAERCYDLLDVIAKYAAIHSGIPDTRLLYAWRLAQKISLYYGKNSLQDVGLRAIVEEFLDICAITARQRAGHALKMIVELVDMDDSGVERSARLLKASRKEHLNVEEVAFSASLIDFPEQQIRAARYRASRHA